MAVTCTRAGAGGPAGLVGASAAGSPGAGGVPAEAVAGAPGGVLPEGVDELEGAGPAEPAGWAGVRCAVPWRCGCRVPRPALAGLGDAAERASSESVPRFDRSR